MGHVLVMKISLEDTEEDREPILLIALNGAENANWDEMQAKVEAFTLSQQCVINVYPTLRPSLLLNTLSNP